ncbi:hypothetical protein GCM10028808_74820 [Spirosoma migulaei]
MNTQSSVAICICLLLFSTIFSNAQEAEKTRIYETRSNIAIVPCDVKGNRVYKNSYYERAPFKARFAVIRALKDEYVVRFLTWSTPSDSTTPPGNNSSLAGLSTSATPEQIVQVYRINLNDPLKLSTSNTNVNDSIRNRQITTGDFKIGRFFLIAKSDLDSNCVKVFATWFNSATFTLGLVTMPMKLRLGPNFDFQGNLSLGTTAGGKMRISKYSSNYLNVMLGLSLSTVSLDSFSTGGRISGQPLTNIAVFSPSLGAVLEFGKAQIGAFLGWDLLNKSTKSKYDWIYDRKPWLSVGFGFSIFAVDSKVTSSQNIKQTVPTSAPKD